MGIASLVRLAPGAHEHAAAIDAWLADGIGDGQRRCYRVTTRKADLMIIDYQHDPAALFAMESSLSAQPFADFIEPVYGYFSVVEASLYEATAMAHGKLSPGKVSHQGKDGFDAAFATELGRQREHLEQRVFRDMPDSHVCFYPMSKRRGEQVNWYDTPLQRTPALDARPRPPGA